ncbi:MAG: 50S ribosomal protein L24 [Chloroflexi bacterium]|nr:50S ribosomal protein L24 [Chloroflexota bacterium]
MTQAKFKIKKGDMVEVITGRDKGRRGEVVRVLPKKARVVVQGVNRRKRHRKSYQAGGRTLEGGIIEFEAPIHISNVMLICPKCGQRTRVGIRRDEDGTRHRVCKKCGADID